MQLPFVARRAGGKVAVERLKKRLAAAGRAFVRAVSPSPTPRFRRLSLESLEGRRVLACDSAFSFTRVTYDPAHPANIGSPIDAATPTNEGNSGATVFRYLLRDNSYSVVGRDYTYSYAIDGFGSFSINNADLLPGLALDGTFTHGDLTSGNYLIDVIVQGDNIVEPNESFKVTLTGAAGDPITGACSFELQSTIGNDDSTSVIVNGSSSVAITEGGSGAVSLKLTNPVQGGLTVALTSSPGTATPVNDGYVVPASVTFTGNANEVRSATITTQQDNMVEADETFTVAMGAVTTPAGISSTSVTATDHWDLQIKNDDATTVSIGGGTVSEGGTATFPITLTNPVFGGLRIDWQVVAGTAVATSDFSTSTSVQTIVVEGTSAEVTVNTVDDVVPELPEQFTVRLSNLRAVDTAIAASNFSFTGGGASTSATGVITDDDFVPFEVSNPTVTEGGDLKFDVKVLRAIVLPFTLDYTVGNGTAAAADADYTPVSGALSFSGVADETKTVTVVTGSDSKVEADETVMLNLINLNILFIFPYTIPLVGDRQVAPGIGTIANDDTASLRVSDATSVVEGGTLSFTVAMTGEVQGGFDLVYNTADGTGVDAATAADNDYTSTPNGTFRFNGSSGETRTFTVPTRSDGKVEADEKVRFVLRSVQPLISAIDADDITF
ncbi:MAG TPA: Calx-beta domain-containing protein, partial [Pirellulaceae bacterium]|nr:Calx-beta domain-containing protein [Pirellulaceae bacterium]